MGSLGHAVNMSSEAAEAVAAMLASRQQEREADYRQRTTARAEIRAAFKRRRDAGLKRRHAQKMARIRAAGRLV